MHFGPEWMRAKPQPCPPRQQPPPSPPPPPPPPQVVSATQQLGTSTYSALVAPAPQEPDKRDESRPFRYTKDAMLRIYKEGGGKGGLNLEVERWEGIVRDVGSEPAGLHEMTEAEKKVSQSIIPAQCPLFPRSHDAASSSPAPSIPNFVGASRLIS